MGNETLNIKLQSWDHTCSDGCCSSWGTNVFINDEIVSNGDYDDIRLILKEVLTELGYNVVEHY
jgi:hypothetical protein